MDSFHFAKTRAIDGYDPWELQLVLQVHLRGRSKLLSVAILTANYKVSHMLVFDLGELVEDIGVCKELINPPRVQSCVGSEQPLHV